MSPRKSAVLVIALIATLISCRRQPAAAASVPSAPPPAEAIVPEAQGDSLAVAYSRSPCFGMCPVFECRIYRSGYAVYKGINFVDHIGWYHATLASADIRDVMATADRIGYFSMREVYDEPRITDLPSVTTALAGKNGIRRVVNRYGGPRQLEELYQQLDILLEEARWRPLEKEPAGWDQ